ncbi:hypothetical protein TNCV_113021 [Trichonephila clavipes]|nr:hypothetical protein TNCV_113021 [Trichonephila clavipes]
MNAMIRYLDHWATAARVVANKACLVRFAPAKRKSTTDEIPHSRIAHARSVPKPVDQPPPRRKKNCGLPSSEALGMRAGLVFVPHFELSEFQTNEGQTAPEGSVRNCSLMRCA